MIYLLIILIGLGLVYLWYSLDIFVDYRGKFHIIIWYTNSKGVRKFINLLGSQE